MTPSERFDRLPAATWPRLRGLLDAHAPGGEVINMTIGEPRHAFPDWVPTVLAEHAHLWRKYPDNNGIEVLRLCICDWLKRRYGVTFDHDTQVMALNGTREGLYNAAMALSTKANPVILVPNPFYQVYAIASISVGAEPVFINATAATGHLPDLDGLDPATLDRVDIAYLCSPANPQGAVANKAYWNKLIALAEKHDFKIFADECYSEIYRNTAPTGVLEAAADTEADPERVVAFHSLSKRSNLAGLRSGFVASGPQNIARIKRLRAYAGAPLPEPIQQVSARLWADEEHVEENRTLYRDKFDAADVIFDGVEGYASPEAGFFLWLDVEDGEAAAVKLWRDLGVRTLPGAYLARDAKGTNPGKRYIRVALVAPKEETQRGLTQIRDCLYAGH